jgi:ADP-heptose:LPS heptosyltransferase
MFLGAAANWMRLAALLCTNTVLKSTATGTPRPDRVLIVRLDAIGDFVLWLDAAQALVDHYKAHGKSAVLVANATWASWARDLGIFEDVIAIDVQKFQQSPLYRYRLGRAIQKQGCIIAVNSTFSRHWLLDDSVIRISGADARIGSIGDSLTVGTWKRRTANRWYTRLMPADPSPCMELERNAEFVRNLGETGFEARLPQLNTAKAVRTDDAFLSAIAGQPYYVLFPGASWMGKKWPVSGFLQVAEKLHRRTGWQGVICGGPSDLELAAILCEQSSAPMLNWAGLTDLPQLAAILSAARLLLSNDTSATHIAAACNVPTVCLLGGGQFGRFMPYQIEKMPDRRPPHAVIHRMPCFGCDWHCIYPHSPDEPLPCIEKISVNDVWRAISEELGFPD